MYVSSVCEKLKDQKPAAQVQEEEIPAEEEEVCLGQNQHSDRVAKTCSEK